MKQPIQALVFDIFGTVVDWRGSIIAEGLRYNAEHQIQIDWAELADAWRAEYQPAMARVRAGLIPWTTIDQLHRMILDKLLPRFGLAHLDEGERQHLNRVWHRLTPWADVVTGLARLRENYLVTPLSNGNMALLVNLSKRAGLNWDCILSAELARHYKPDPEAYQMVGELLDLPQSALLMVAAHVSDLVAARATGMKIALVQRPLEYGEHTPLAEPPEGCDFVAQDFHNLADQLLGK